MNKSRNGRDGLAVNKMGFSSKQPVIHSPHGGSQPNFTVLHGPSSCYPPAHRKANNHAYKTRKYLFKRRNPNGQETLKIYIVFRERKIKTILWFQIAIVKMIITKNK